MWCHTGVRLTKQYEMMMMVVVVEDVHNLILDQ
jgi:hypothetical protein